MAFVEKLALLLHGHSHEAYESPGSFTERETRRLPPYRNFRKRAFTVGIGGPVGTGKTALLKALHAWAWSQTTSSPARMLSF